jgi:hypothetical protein
MYCSPYIVRVIKLRKIRWAGIIAGMREKCMKGFGGETGRKVTAWKTQA